MARLSYLAWEIILVRDANLRMGRFARRKNCIIPGKRRLGENRISQFAGRLIFRSTMVYPIALIKLRYNTGYIRKPALHLISMQVRISSL